ncbi:MAG: cobalamin-dependent protein [Planctomycetes bacterium]|nr:cobalamin-dependent protein [Planctomycetota bacterium]
MPHVALVPLVGVRVADPELRALGLTLPGLRDRTRALGNLPALGLLTLAGLTPRHWTQSWHPAAVCTYLPAELARLRPDLVAVSALTASITEAYALCDALRALGLRTVLGGLHATALPAEAEQHADAVVVGEGEPVWQTVLSDCERGALQRRYVAPRADLGAAPLPAWRLAGALSRYSLQTQRGCPFACEFCGASRLLGPFREKPLARIEDELAQLAALSPRPVIELADDNTFAGHRDHAALLDVLRQRGARWFSEADWRIGEQPHLLVLLAASGCVQLLVGVESLAHAFRGMGAKGVELPRVLRAIEAIQAAGVAVNACFVVGADGESEASLAALAELVGRGPFADVQLTLQTPFPGTALRARLEAEGRLLPGAGWDHHTLFDLCFVPDNLPAETLHARFKSLVALAYSSAARKRRARIRREVWRGNTGLHPWD